MIWNIYDHFPNKDMGDKVTRPPYFGIYMGTDLFLS